jgi:hypothetical protein
MRRLEDPATGIFESMKQGEPFDPDQLRVAAAAHVSERNEERRVAEDLARAVEAALDSGMSMVEIAEIISTSSREAIIEPPLAA